MVTISMHAVEAAIDKRTVLHGITASFRAGEMIGIVGPNGAGKSSLVRAMLGIQPILSGRILIDGRDIGDLDRRTAARTMAYLPQGQTLHWPLEVERLVAIGRLPHLAPLSRLSDEDMAAIDKALVEADAESLRGRIATELSGGERARVLLARTLAVDAPILLADEPLAALDPGHQLDVLELLNRQARAGKLVVTVLHDLSMAARYCDRLLVLNNGRLVADGPPRAVLTPALIADVYGIGAELIESATGTLIVPVRRC